MPLDSNNEIYVDNAATTSMSKDVLDSMLPYFSRNYGNPSSLYSLAQVSRDAVEVSRETIADILNCKPSEIVFNSGGTESDNLAIIGVSKALEPTGKHLITSKIEHHAVIHAMEEMESLGFKVTYLDVDKDGFVNLDQLEQCITSDTTLISIMYANNETGAIQPIKEIGQIIKKKSIDLNRDIYFHTDAVQAAGKLSLDVEELGVDLMTISGHKFYGPKGAGILYTKNPTHLKPMIIGGNQEYGLRGGTENLISIAGMALAAELINEELESHIIHLTTLERYFKSELQDFNGKIIFNGDQSNKLPGLISVSFPGHKSSKLMIKLDQAEMYVSNGSACGSGNIKPSPVLKALGFDDLRNFSTIRFSFGVSNSLKDVEALINQIKKII